MKRKYVCLLRHGLFVFYSAYRLNSKGNKEDAKRAFMKHHGYRDLPIQEFDNIVNWKDYPIDEPAINS